MGFEWARPTSFDEPTFVVGDHVVYYAVDHTPVVPVELGDLGEQQGADPVPAHRARGWSEAWDADETLSRAIEIRDGRVMNPAILAFQGREAEPPYRVA